ncbi:MAG: hypothetical protein EBY21_10570 [Alphaproteobacteria bacterium]|nr:hypothetical protein [Alphaproteobacteria bacterium]
MTRTLLIAMGAGLAAALLFVVPMQGSAMAMAMTFLAGLPLMIAGLGFGQVAALVAGVTGALSIALFLDPLFSLSFAFSLALPAYWLCRLGSLCREDEAGQIHWYPISKLLVSIVYLSILTSLLVMLVLILRAGSYDSFVADSTARLIPALESVWDQARMPGSFKTEDLARLIILALPLVMSGWTVITLGMNLWLAGRIVQISQLLQRPWEELPESLSLPASLSALATFSFLGLMIDGPIRVLSSAALAAIVTAYALVGMAIIHALTRGMSGRSTLLTLLYVIVLILMPWPLILPATFGVIDSFYPLRRRKIVVTPTPNPED